MHKFLIFARGLAGAAVGGAIGYFAFRWLLGQGFYALALPGALLGLGCSLASGARSVVQATLCGVGGLLLATFSEWHTAPFRANASWTYFVGHADELKPVTLVMIGLSIVFAAWFGYGRLLPATAKPPKDQNPDPA